jgi:hypothetical protein
VNRYVDRGSFSTKQYLQPQRRQIQWMLQAGALRARRVLFGSLEVGKVADRRDFTGHEPRAAIEATTRGPRESISS